MSEVLAPQRLADKMGVTPAELLLFIQVLLPTMTARQQIVVRSRFCIDREAIILKLLAVQLGLSAARTTTVAREVEQKIIFAYAEHKRTLTTDLRTLLLREYIIPQQAKRAKVSWPASEELADTIVRFFSGADKPPLTLGMLLERTEYFMQFRVRLTTQQLAILRKLLASDGFTLSKGLA